MEFKHLIGNNLRLYRESRNYTQDQVADFLKVDRSAISYYESGAREIPFPLLKNLCSLFGIDMSALIETDENARRTNFAFAFRRENFDPQDLNSIAEFQKIVMNYIKLRAIAEK